MDLFEGRLAVITGGGTGMGRELARQLSGQGCHVALCDVSAEAMAETRTLCLADAPRGTDVSVFVADVSDEAQVLAFAEFVSDEHGSDHINLLFNNAGISGGGSFIGDDRVVWDKVFAVCWGGVYNCTRAFLPMLMESSEGHIVNTSSINGFWASLGTQSAHTAYSTAKFAVKGFSEALINDFRLNAPHIKVSVVMPGHIGTSIALNSASLLGAGPNGLSDEEIETERPRMARLGIPVEGQSVSEVRATLKQFGEMFRDLAPVSAADAATVILEGVRRGDWRILVGEDAQVLDELVREAPENAYEEPFMDRLRARTTWFMP
ncbi:MAG: NAD(P)-dependent dehydrogenase (short-subunit alcohol dehydrogenase family) [Hyphomicrobiaceae bacterium]|jgi:NAD(P)-dependent dehydrogenase (short-subunit alcohol dehydrogenase family)